MQRFLYLHYKYMQIVLLISYVNICIQNVWHMILHASLLKKKKQIVKIITKPLHNICKEENKWKTEKSIQIQSCKTQ